MKNQYHLDSSVVHEPLTGNQSIIWDNEAQLKTFEICKYNFIQKTHEKGITVLHKERETILFVTFVMLYLLKFSPTYNSM